jgi:hypothetical protein
MFEGIDLKPVAYGTLNATTSTIYTCPADTEAVIFQITLYNAGEGSVGNIYLSVLLGSDESNREVWAGTLESGYSANLQLKLALGAGDDLKGRAGTGDAVEYTVYALEA